MRTQIQVQPLSQAVFIMVPLVQDQIVCNINRDVIRLPCLHAPHAMLMHMPAF